MSVRAVCLGVLTACSTSAVIDVDDAGKDSDVVGDTDTDGSGGGGALVWWADPCGRRDPVERTCPDGVGTIEVGDALTCADQGIRPGERCTERGATCVALPALACADAPDTLIASQAVLTCDSQPPDDLCPQSSRSVKRDLAYVDAAGRDALAAQVLALKLATYRYAPGEGLPGTRLGYVLQDAPDAPFSGEGRVDLYAYTSAVVATVQAQQAELDALRAEVAALRAACAER